MSKLREELALGSNSDQLVLIHAMQNHDYIKYLYDHLILVACGHITTDEWSQDAYSDITSDIQDEIEAEAE